MEIFVDTAGRLRDPATLGHVTARDVFGAAIENECPFDLDLGYLQATDNRRIYAEPERTFLPLEGTWTFRLSVPGLVFEGSRIRFVADGDEYSDYVDLKTLDRHQVETLINDLPAVTTHGGATVEGMRGARGTVYRVQFVELGTAPTLRWEVAAGAHSIAACQAPAESLGAGGRIALDIWLPDEPQLEWELSETTAPDAVTVTPIGPAFDAAGVQIDRITISDNASGEYVLRVTGQDPTNPIPVDASPADVLAAIRATSPGVYSSARWAGSRIIDLIHQDSGIQAVIDSDDIFATVPAIKTATIAHGGLVADNLAGGKHPVKIEILREVTTVVNGLSSPTVESIYTATL